MTTPFPSSVSLPLTTEQLTRLQALTADFSDAQLAWLSGYCWGKLNQTPTGTTDSLPAAPVITLLSATQTGNARRLAEQLRDELLAQHLNVVLCDAGDYKFKRIAQEKLLIVVISTQGEGDPPEEAQALYGFLMSKRAPALNDTAFAVFGLGDSSYPYFCQAGKEMDKRLAELGAERLLPRVDADVDYAGQALAWREQIVALLKARLAQQPTMPVPPAGDAPLDEVFSTPYHKDAPLTASVLVNQKITGRHSEKDIRHIEIDIADAQVRYQPGDALGVWYKNDPQWVSMVMDLLRLPEQSVEVNGQPVALSEALISHVELMVNTPQTVERYAALSESDMLQTLLTDKAALQAYAQTTPIVEMFRQAPAAISAGDLMKLLRPLTPRLYSIASSQAENVSEIHLTVAAVRYEINGRKYTGSASGWLAGRITPGDELRVFIEYNDHFRLPKNPELPIIMIGAGTGIAPFRAFMQQRDNVGAAGKNWLFFGNPHFTEDFLYQVEWQRYVKQGLLTRIDLAWSRDQPEKVYVQHKLRQQGAEIWRWIEQGAHIYVCGDAARMAKAVEKALLEVIAVQGKMNSDAANDFLNELRVARRYQRDIY